MSDGADLRDEQQVSFERDVDEFLRYLSVIRGLSPNTLRAYRTDLRAYCRWVRREGILPLEVSHRQLRGYLLELNRAGYSGRTINRHLSAIRTCYRWLVATDRAHCDAADALSSPKQERRLPRVMSDEDATKLIESCGKGTEGLRDRAFLELLYATGARVSEASGLDLGDVDLDRMQVRLLGKGSKERIVPIYRVAADALRDYVEQARPLLAVHRRDPQPTQALFLSTRGRRMSAAALRKRFEEHVRTAGLDPGLTPHAMRHTFATELLSGGADMRSVQELLGHESLATTQIYTHLSVDRLKQATRLAHPRAEATGAKHAGRVES